MTLTKAELKKWVDYARENKSVILFDSAYEAYISEKDVPHSIYEIEGAREVAIEFRSFSKTAGFTGTRCAYTIVPKELAAYSKSGEKHNLNRMWYRRQATKFNGVSYIVQRGAEAIFSREEQEQVKEMIRFYMANAKIIREGLLSMGIQVFGGINAPYIWLEYKSELNFDVLFMHHYGLCVDVGPWHGFWGRFMKADTPVPEGFLWFDFVPHNDGKAGPPFFSQFAYATFSGDMDAMHRREGYDSDAMYDVTRNIMLGQGVPIPYPGRYWTAEVFLDGCDQYSTAYMFSAEL